MQPTRLVTGPLSADMPRSMLSFSVPSVACASDCTVSAVRNDVLQFMQNVGNVETDFDKNQLLMFAQAS